MHIHEMNATAHWPTPHGYACWLQPAATRPFPQITLDRLVIMTLAAVISNHRSAEVSQYSLTVLDIIKISRIHRW